MATCFCSGGCGGNPMADPGTWPNCSCWCHTRPAPRRTGLSNSPAPWWYFDEAYDRVRASDGLSRYGAYLADRLAAAGEEIDDPPHWTAWCWRVATRPIMRPPFVCERDPIIETWLWPDPDTGGLTATVNAAAPLPDRLGSPWRDWHISLVGDLTYGATPRALTRVEFEAVLDPPSGGWVEPPSFPCSRDVLVAAATEAVRRAAAALERRYQEPLTVLAAGLGLIRTRSIEPRGLGLQPNWEHDR